MIRLLEELVRVVGYGGVGLISGFLMSTWVNDRHRIATAVLNESERDVPNPKRRLSSQVLQFVVVVLVMVALLATGLSWLQAGQRNAEQDRRDCLRSIAVAQALQRRTDNYIEAAIVERDLWRDVRRVFIQSGASDNPLLESIDKYLEQQRVTLAHLRENPYPKASPESC